MYLGKWLKLLYEVCRVRDILSFLFVSKDEINPLVEMSRHVFTLWKRRGVKLVFLSKTTCIYNLRQLRRKNTSIQWVIRFLGRKHLFREDLFFLHKTSSLCPTFYENIFGESEGTPLKTFIHWTVHDGNHLTSCISSVRGWLLIGCDSTWLYSHWMWLYLAVFSLVVTLLDWLLIGCHLTWLSSHSSCLYLAI